MKTIYVAVSENDRRLVIDGSLDLLDALLHVVQSEWHMQDKPKMLSAGEKPTDRRPAEVQNAID